LDVFRDFSGENPVAKSPEPCSARVDPSQPLRPLLLQNDLLAATILLDKGADIYELTYKPKATDVLWKTPWGLKRSGPGVPSTADSTARWLEVYPGGWQEIFPNGGAPCSYRGAELNMHGEASVTSWDWQVVQDNGPRAEVRLTTRLARSPFRIERTMHVETGKPILYIDEQITNEGDEPMAYMWGHHPAYGAPFLSESCRIDLDAKSIRADDAYDPPNNPMHPDRDYAWPMVERDGRKHDLSRVPPKCEPSACLGYLHDFKSGWYGITNTAMGFGIGLTWPVEVFPYAWLWRELSSSSGYPWYRAAHTMAIEPFTTIPGQGLATGIKKGTHRTLEAGATVTANIRALFYESRVGITGINADGTVIQRK
jgi:galactose mutarotase-like enzyme